MFLMCSVIFKTISSTPNLGFYLAPFSMFRFKQFSIAQDKCAMKVGTDGVLLGAWATYGCKYEQGEKPKEAYLFSKSLNILDIGTGTGLIALMLAQRFANAHIHALEIKEAAYLQAKNNFTNSPWPNRLVAQHIALQQFASLPSYQQHFDLIVSNPPFFQQSLKTKNTARNLARHADETLPFTDLITGIKTLLSPSGYVCLILPFTEAQTFISLAKTQQLFLQTQVNVFPKKHKIPNRLLLQFGFQNNLSPSNSALVLRNHPSNEYTAAYQALTKDFHPMF